MYPGNLRIRPRIGSISLRCAAGLAKRATTGPKAMDLGELIAGLGVRAAGTSPVAPAGVRICDITDDSRTVLPGSLFIARVGTKFDGREFIADALAAGAVAILSNRDGIKLPAGSRYGAGAIPLMIAEDLPPVAAAMAERFYGYPTSKLDLIGVTGTNGKTTIAHLVHQILCSAGKRCGLIGTVMVDDGVSVGPATLTTPPALELSRTFGVMVEAGCEAAVMETSSHALDQCRVASLKYDIGIFTNLTGDHLDYHGTMESYAAAKARLFESLPEAGWAIVNDSDAWTERMLRDCRARVVRCRVSEGGSALRAGAGVQQSTQTSASSSQNDARTADRRSTLCEATIESMTMSGTRVTFAGPWGEFSATIRVVGLHNVMNALQAVAACWALGVSADQLSRQIVQASAPPGRLEPVTGPRDPFTVLVDYAHTDDALRKVMTAVQPLVPRGGEGEESGRLCVVFGCGGDRDRTKRPRMGAAAAEIADVVVVTSDNPRTERPSEIIDGILSGIPGIERHKVQVEVDRRRAIRKVIEQAQPGDVILIAGKGHETEQILPDGRGGTIRQHFDDCEVAREALAELRMQRKAASPQ